MMGLGFGLAIEKKASGGAAPTPTPPVNTVAPAISGTLIVNNILTCSTGTWTGIPAPTFTRQWQRDGSDIGGATGASYQLTTSDGNHSIRCVVTAHNSSGNVPANSNLVFPTQTTLTYSPVLTGIVGALYTGATPSTSGGTAPYSYSISSGTLPTSTSLNGSTGVISGTPTVANAFTGIGLTVLDANFVPDTSALFTITITKTTLTYSPVTTGQQFVPYTGATPSTTGGTAPYTYSISSGTLPLGLTLNTSTGVISGTPTLSGSSSGLVLTVTDTNGISDNSAPFTITIATAGGGSGNSFPGTLIGGV